MKHSKRTLALSICLVFVLSLILTACGGNNNAGSTSTGGSAASGSAASGSSASGGGGSQEQSSAEEIDWSTVEADISFVYPGTSESEKLFAETFKEKMKEKYPKVNIEIMYLSWSDMETKLSVMINSGQSPDIASTQDVTYLVNIDGLEDLRSYMDREDSTIKVDSFLPGTLEYTTYGENIYAVPALANSFALIVNEEMLNEVGMKVEDLKTWADIEKAAALMTKDGNYGFGYPLSVARFAFRVPLTAAYSNDLRMDDTSEESKGKYLELLQHFENMKPYMPEAQVTWGYPEMFRAYSNGEVGMIAAGTFFSANVYSINPDIIAKSRAIAYPQGPSGSSAKAPVSSVGYGIFKNSKNKEVAWRLIQELLSPEFNAMQSAIVNISAVKATTLDAVMSEAESVYPKAIDGHKNVTNDLLNMVDTSGVSMDIIVGQPEMETIVQENMVKMLTGKSNVEETYNFIKAGIDAIKEKYASVSK